MPLSGGAGLDWKAQVVATGCGLPAFVLPAFVLRVAQVVKNATATTRVHRVSQAGLLKLGFS